MRVSKLLFLVAGIVSLGVALGLVVMVWQFSVVLPYMSLPLAGLLLGVALALTILAGLLLLRAK